MRRIGLIGFFIAFCFFPSFSWAESPSERMKTFLQSGVEKGLHLDEKGAVAELMKAIDLDRENPMGYACLAMAYLFSYETAFDEKEKKVKEAFFLRAAENALVRAEKKIEKDSRNGEAFFAAAIAKMARNRYEIILKNYIRAFRQAQNVWDYLEKVQELDPENYDVYYPMGIFHYYLSQLSGVARWITSLFITSGDREKGLKELEWAAEKGLLLKDLAQSNLISAYAGYEKKPAQALPFARRLKAKYPENYNFSFALGNILSDLGQTEEALSLAREIANGIKSGIPPYRPELWPRHSLLLGKIALDQGEYGKATEYFNQALKEKAPYNVRVRAYALLRLGMIRDARQDRKGAEEFYRQVLDLEGAEGTAQRMARDYLEAPYSPKIQEGKK